MDRVWQRDRAGFKRLLPDSAMVIGDATTPIRPCSIGVPDRRPGKGGAQPSYRPAVVRLRKIRPRKCPMTSWLFEHFIACQQAVGAQMTIVPESVTAMTDRRESDRSAENLHPFAEGERPEIGKKSASERLECMTLNLRAILLEGEI